MHVREEVALFLSWDWELVVAGRDAWAVHGSRLVVESHFVVVQLSRFQFSPSVPLVLVLVFALMPVALFALVQVLEVEEVVVVVEIEQLAAAAGVF